MKNPLNYFDVYACIIWSIKQLLGKNWEVLIVHTYKEGNMSADWLAKKKGAMGDESLVYWDEPPLGIGNLLLADSMGVCFYIL